MKNTIRTYILKPLVLLVLFFGLAVNAMALDIKSAKQQGLLGEQDNGYVGVVKDSGDAKRIANDVNKKRKARYQQIAKKVGKPLSVVEKQAGAKAIEKTPSGQFVRKGSGSWKKK